MGRLFRLGQPDSVVFDEVNFRKFAGKYIGPGAMSTFNPQLTKLLIILAAWIGGYNGLLFTPHNALRSYELIPLSNRRLQLW
jgi:dolichyl-phosphate-mannose--protein O-mannosyl transferase